ncbi:MAG: DEAD/DEAH box helicase [Burkholderiales bacterium]|nr:DEAD/DEAH box helicase [Burkholderiales bacterium]
MAPNYFSSLLSELRTRSARATVGTLGFSNQILRRHLLSLLSREYGSVGSLIAEPVFEATFGWKTAEKSMKELSGSLLHPSVVDAMDKPSGNSSENYQFPKNASPYVHQLDAWNALLGNGCKSTIITSGTGSGKTECFMVPVLSSIAEDRTKKDSDGGVQAIFVYPLNALIQSQRERLRAWTGPFDGEIRFCLYNGMTPEESRADRYKESPNEVHDRKILRSRPPEILVTNPTMLEYMLVRAQDAPILEKSQGKLRWIVLDEAHNYIGSQAAELALLLRRVIHAFGCTAEDVHFVATSATIGANDEATRGQLKNFLARLAGVSVDRVTVISGEREIPKLDRSSRTAGAAISINELNPHEKNPKNLYERLLDHPVARSIRSAFITDEGGIHFQTIKTLQLWLNQRGYQIDQDEVIRWLDLLTIAKTESAKGTLPFLPLRLHVFHNTMAGLWVCIDRNCKDKVGTELANEDWVYGSVFTEERTRCTCGAPTFPLVTCSDCNSDYLLGEIRSDEFSRLLGHPRQSESDDFLLDREVEDEDDAGDGLTVSEDLAALSTQVLIANNRVAGANIHLDRKTTEILTNETENSLLLRVHEPSPTEDRTELTCPECKNHRKGGVSLRHPRLGAPFYLSNVIPTMLEYCPDGKEPLDTPRRGRRLIAFTDSRQGTARIAAKLEQDAERSALRASVYRKLISRTSSTSGESEKLKEEIAQINALIPAADSSIRSYFLGQISEKEDALRKLQAGSTVKHTDMVDWLSSHSPDIRRWMYATYSDLDDAFKGDAGHALLARILLCREFGRRPTRPMNLENSGLVSVQYPKLSLLTKRRIAVEQAGLSLEEWRSFLKVTLDFFVRANWIIEMPPSWKRWGAERVFPKHVLSPNSVENPGSGFLRWPKSSNKGKPSRLVRYLARVLNLNLEVQTSRNQIDALLLAAWEDLTETTGLLKIGTGGRYLDLSDTAYQCITDAWVCPVTRRILDVTVRDITPYVPATTSPEALTIAKKIRIPECDVAGQDFTSEDQRLLTIRNWLDNQPEVQAARFEGVWSDLNDRVLEAAGFFRTAEHSAQQSGVRLEHYESMFKKGLINLLSCSTTMEMGVDIGGINMVAMNNVPPHPANYLQRAGRAGRRSELRAVALTVCKSNLHDQNVFKNPTWPFITKLRSPGISLSSQLIVTRHLNSLILADFLRRSSSGSTLNKLTLEWWMLPRGTSPQEKFVAWCECFIQAQNVDLSRGISAVKLKTVLEGRGPERVVADAALHIAGHAKKWLTELHALERQLAEVSKQDEENTIPKRALEIQIKRLKGEYLLRELSSGGVLPGYGFPTDITTFETINKDSRELQRKRDSSNESREDNKFQRRELPSRDTVTALREYAPGAQVVIDGLVYRSSGITLNWHAPATVSDVKELQNIRQAWRCGRCGMSGTFVVAEKYDHCPQCSSALDLKGRYGLQYLEPAGFSVAISDETHNDIAHQQYLPVEKPWITSEGRWVPLVNPVLGRFRASSLGSVFHYSSGANRAGYALCLECGRADSMDSDTVPPTNLLKAHKRLRGSRDCIGTESEFRIKKGLFFGREYKTDVLEILLNDRGGQPLVDSKIAYTIAVTVRRAIAESLGVEEAEIGCETKLIRDDYGRKIQAIQLFDVRSAGYSSAVSSNLNELLRRAHSFLHCPGSCDAACQLCLLGYETRFRSDDLDRATALKFLNEEWLDDLKLSPEDQIFGAISRAEFQFIDEAIIRELNGGTAKHLYLYLHGDCSEYDMPSSPLKRLLHKLSLRDEIAISLVLTAKPPHVVSRENIAVIQGIKALRPISVVAGKGPTLPLSGSCLATIEKENNSFVSWAARDPQVSKCDRNWGARSEGVLVSGFTGSPSVSSIELDLAESHTSGLRVFEICDQLNGPGSGFGNRFWSLLAAGNAESVIPPDAAPVEIIYEDRYLSSPIACGILVDVISALKVMYERRGDWGSVAISIYTMHMPEQKIRLRAPGWDSDWTSSEDRDSALNAAFEYCGMDAKVISMEKRNVMHGRRMTIRLSNKREIVVWLDQGWSYWSLSREMRSFSHISFDGNFSPESTGKALAEFGVNVQGHDLPTYVFIE